MKLMLGAVLIVALAVIGNCISRIYKRRDKLARTVRRILWIGLSIIAFNMCSLFTLSRPICMLAYSAYFIATDWLLYYLLRFSIEYIGNEFEKHVNRPLMVALLLLDSVSIALNNIFTHLFRLKRVFMFGGEIFFEMMTEQWFYIHYAIIMMLAVFCLISLFYGAMKAANFYRRKYLLIAVILLILVVMNIFTFQSAVDVSVIGYAVEGVCIYYCALVYTPQRLMSKTVFQVSDNMTFALMAMDLDGKRIYCNKYAKNYLECSVPLRDKDDVTLEEWCRGECLKYMEEFEIDKIFYQERKEFFLKIQRQCLWDEKKQYQGSYFVIQDRSKEVNNQKRERYLATHDTLTGLYNKEYFYEQTKQYIKEHPQEELLLLCSDIKDFKMVNDIFGKKIGDKTLQRIAKMLETLIGSNAVFGRLDSDHFAVLVPKAYFSEELFENESHIDISDFVEESVSFPVINYIGVYEIADRTLPVSVMCDRARMAIVTIKGDQRKTVEYYDDTIRDNILHEQELIADLKDAIEQEQLQMYLQPQMSAEGKMMGAEALVRWIHPKKGRIVPGDFLPIFEKNGLITEIDKYIWECACKQLKKWKNEGRENIYISVNISPKDMYFLDIHQIFTELVKKYDIDSRNLKLEITETAVMMDFKRQLELIGRLRNAGFAVEMDDFGSGYSSLNMLKDIHVDVLKIDMGFLAKNQDTERGKTILQMVISLSKQLGMSVITEGVEIEEQLQFLTDMGCDIFQGYYFAKPMEVNQFEKLYFE